MWIRKRNKLTGNNPEQYFLCDWSAPPLEWSKDSNQLWLPHLDPFEEKASKTWVWNQRIMSAFDVLNQDYWCLFIFSPCCIVIQNLWAAYFLAHMRDSELVPDAMSSSASLRRTNEAGGGRLTLENCHLDTLVTPAFFSPAFYNTLTNSGAQLQKCSSCFFRVQMNYFGVQSNWCCQETFTKSVPQQALDCAICI